jgi:hypothetical protein
MRHAAIPFVPFLALALSSACVTVRPHQPLDDRQPRSVLIMPPLNETPEVNAPEMFLSTVTRPLAERGYYVFPVAVVEQMLKDNGLPTPAEMNQVPLAKIREVFAPDAVLYVRIKDWGTRYMILASTTRVTIECTLIDAASGEVLWTGRETEAEGTGVHGGGGGKGAALAALIVGLTAAVVHQVAANVDEDHPRRLASRANVRLFEGQMARGPYLLDGPAGPVHSPK